MFMPLYSFNPSALFKILSTRLLPTRSRSALLHRIISELDMAERRAKSPQDLPGQWQNQHIEPIALSVPRGAWRIVHTGRADYVLRLRNNHVSGRGFATQEVWVQDKATELYIEIGIQGIRIRLDGTWIAKIVRRLDPRSGRESINISGRVDQSSPHMSWLADTLTTLLSPLKLVADNSEAATARSAAVGSQFVTIRRNPARLAKTASRVIHLP